MDPMTANFDLIGGAAFTLSLFNVVVPVWLGVTVLTSAEERSPGVWLAGLSLLAAGLFFTFHTAMLYGLLPHLLREMRIPEQIGWVPITLLPLAWYGTMLWFAGYFRKGENPGGVVLRITAGVLLVMLIGIGLLLFHNYSVAAVLSGPYQSIHDREHLYASIYSGGEWPVLFILYIFYLLLCYGAALITLRNLKPTGRESGDAARMRARPWLVAATGAQTGIVLVVGALFLQVVRTGRQPVLLAEQLFAFRGYDLAILFLVTAALLLLGEAIVRYEIFTGVVIPRRGFLKRWRGVLLMGGGIGAGAAVAIWLRIPGIYGVLGSIVSLAVLYAFLTRRSILERDRYLDDLRSFLVLAKETTDTRNSVEEETARSFRLLCRDVLNARSGGLFPVESASPLFSPLAFPEIPTIPIEEFRPRSPDPGSIAVMSSPSGGEEEYTVIGLWSGEGMAGLLVLGEKEDGGLYTREELELARGACERFLEILIRKRMADHLTRLQGERLSENRVQEIRVRRLLHDEVLPQIHAAMLALRNDANRDEAVATLGDIHRLVSDLLRDLPVSVIESIERAGFVRTFRRLLEDEFRNTFAKVKWNVDEGIDVAVSSLPPLAAETLYQAAREAVRNAARHAGGDNPSRPVDLLIGLCLNRADNRIELIVEDNGVGLPTPSVTSSSGTGRGLKLHGTMMEIVGGSMKTETPGQGGTRVRLLLSAGD